MVHLYRVGKLTEDFCLLERNMHQATKTLATAPIMQLGSFFISPSLPDKNDKPCLRAYNAALKLRQTINLKVIIVLRVALG